jgi:hypothetical protein
MTEAENQDDMDGFDSSAGVMAYIYSKEGAEALRALLALMAAEREMLERDAKELIEVGLPAVADIVLEAAANTPPKQNPHPEETADWRDWNRRHHQDFTGFLASQ